MADDELKKILALAQGNTKEELSNYNVKDVSIEQLNELKRQTVESYKDLILKVEEKKIQEAQLRHDNPKLNLEDPMLKSAVGKQVAQLSDAVQSGALFLPIYLEAKARNLGVPGAAPHPEIDHQVANDIIVAMDKYAHDVVNKPLATPAPPKSLDKNVAPIKK